MRISDWSSRRVLFRSARDLARVRFEQAFGHRLALAVPALGEQRATVREDRRFAAERREFVAIGRRHGADIEQRSEEHTSELQSLMRTPYAVSCLKQQTPNRN